MSQNNNANNKKAPKFNYYWIYGIIALALLLFFTFTSTDTRLKEADWEEVKGMIEDGDVNRIVVVNNQNAEVFLYSDSLGKERYSEDEIEKTNQFFGQSNQGPHYIFTVSSGDQFKEDLKELYAQMDADGMAVEPVSTKFETRTSWLERVGWLLPIIIIVALWIFIMRRVSGGAGGAGGQIFNIGKSKATMFDQNSKVSITFDDVAGLDEAKEEVMEIVSFLKSPKKYTNLGGKIPKGALLIGPPGTGKTLLAKAMAGEAKVPFFSISGSDFVEMFVGVGASRVRDLFKQAREKAPCIIFIDEIDAIGRARGKQLIQGNDERENTLNQLLVEMDGFSSEKGVIILAATNRPDVLDQALLRPGRFDRQIGIDKPDLKGREQIFKVHLKAIKLGDSIDAEKLATQTPGFVGADIANICNEAALIAARKNKSQVEMDDFNDAIDRSIGGLEKKNKIISPDEKKVIAYHEAGHALCGWFLEHAHPLVKVSIVPRGVAALGYAQYLPKEKYLQTTNEMYDRMCMTMGGRAAEKVIFDEISTGAQSDLDQVTKMSYAMVTVYGMDEEFGNISYYDLMNQNNFQKPYSDETAKAIDDHVRKIIEKQYLRAIDLLKEKESELHLLAKELLDKEVLFKSDLERLIGKRPVGYDAPMEYISWEEDREKEDSKKESLSDEEVKEAKESEIKNGSENNSADETEEKKDSNTEEAST